jgi:hypothetical protein
MGSWKLFFLFPHLFLLLSVIIGAFPNKLYYYFYYKKGKRLTDRIYFFGHLFDFFHEANSIISIAN